ncbi:ketopantoate reductase family protein [Desulfoluna butyratoxydans]|uniref:2-dehydropantoate 2-reductase n=1 Tax=Desulfoluna butyratoxydans TaxID=231438 RepID=A0A4U8YK58_9BACT|nr:2-dehydropantoate 2-reductase [Desulfoluna butyratoxydans]VFQ43817.1 ketopantoate reductase apba/pane [Desulfoluna butyratoxydans]
MKVLVFGGGAVGLGLASCLAEAGVTPDIVTRKEGADAIAEGGLTRTGLLGQAVFRNVRAGVSPDDFSANGPYDYVLVCTKSSATGEAGKALSAVPGLLGPATCVVLCQNGWGNRERVSRWVDPDRVYNARVITGFSRPAPNTSHITVHVAPISMGHLERPMDGELVPLAEALTTGGLSCTPSDDVGKDLWAKMLFNGSLNSLGAIFGVPYGKLSHHPEGLRLMRSVVNEIFAVMAAAGYRTWWETPEEYFAVLTGDLLPTAASHVSSTLQDLKAGKKTEIDALTGEVVRLGEKHGVPVPVNQTVLDIIGFMEKDCA